MLKRIELETKANAENFDEELYLYANPDIAQAVRSGAVASGKSHFDSHGRHEGRLLRNKYDLSKMRREKLARFEHRLRRDMIHRKSGDVFDYISDALRAETKITSTDAVSAHPYDQYGLELVEKFRDGIILDCGAGRRPTYYHNVLNYEIVAYDTTDVLGVGEELPFLDSTFDAVISIAVLEHVRDPFRCAREIARVLKPGGKLLCSVPFLQPEHGYPHHYYNMTRQGLRGLFEGALRIDDHKVPENLLPIWTLTWFLQRWTDSLEGATRECFESLTIGDIIGAAPDKLKSVEWVTGLSEAANFELACGTSLFAHKPL